jgi:hypothetical protein
MPRYKMLVLTQPKEGREKEFNDWYDTIHLHQLVAQPAIKSAQRFEFRQVVAGEKQFPYLAIYDIETDDLGGVLAQLNSGLAAGRISFSDALSPDSWGAVFEEHGPAVRQKP